MIEPGDLGTAGVVYTRPNNPWPVQENWFAVEWMKFGFDADFNPIYMIANGLDPWSWRRYQEHRQSETIASAIDSIANSAFFDNTWISKEGIMPSRQNSWNGWVVLKGNRDSGINVCLDALNINVRIKLRQHNFRPINIPRDLGNGEVTEAIWIVDVIEADGPIAGLERANPHL